MLYRYIVENFMSFKDRGELSMFPLLGEVEGHLIDSPSGHPVLKAAVIYGANAAGKSSLIKSMNFARSFILKNDRLNAVSSPCYKLDKEFLCAPSQFCFEMKIGDKIYQYGFWVQFSTAKVMEEWLYELTADTCFFHRKREEDVLITQEIYPDMGKEEVMRLDFYEEELEFQDEKLLLSRLGPLTYGKSPFWEAVRAVWNWFRELRIVFPDTRFNLLSAVIDDEVKVNQLYQTYFRIFGIDIDNIHLNQVPVELLRIDPDTLADIRKDLLSAEDEKGRKGMLNLHGKEYLLEVNKYGELKAQEVKFRYRKNWQVADFSKDEESDGTQRLFDLIPALARLISQGGVLVIDNIDISLHTLLTREILRKFLVQGSDMNGQLVCTTHDVKLLDLSLLRADEIWFVQKDRHASSKLYPLVQYQVEYPENVEVNYLTGLYKGTPVFKDKEWR